MGVPASGVSVAATTRSAARDQLLRASGADQVFVDTGSIGEEARKVSLDDVDKVLELEEQPH